MGELFWTDEAGEVRRHGSIIIAGSGFDAAIMQKAAPSKNENREIRLRSRGPGNARARSRPLHDRARRRRRRARRHQLHGRQHSPHPKRHQPLPRMPHGRRPHRHRRGRARGDRPATPHAARGRLRSRRSRAGTAPVQDVPGQGGQDNLHPVGSACSSMAS